jgi:aryl-alcohol dehydrogenase-like predicted oxidoreductase
MTRMDRRKFLKTASSGTVGAGLALSGWRIVPTESSENAIPRRPLGKTGLQVTILGFGCVAIGYGGQSIERGAQVVTSALDEGINYIDCASSYGDAELKVGAVMKHRRKSVVLATKTLERRRDASWAEINRSLERLQTDYVDLLQIHAVNSMEDLDRITNRNGSLGAALRAKEEGIVSHIGITGHTRPEVIVEALHRYPFETTLVPLSSTDKLIHDFGDELFPLSREQGFGIVAMKVLAAGNVVGHVPDSLRYSMSLPVSAAVVGMGSEEEVRSNTRVARNFVPLTSVEMLALQERTKQFATTAIMWWKRR